MNIQAYVQTMQRLARRHGVAETGQFIPVSGEVWHYQEQGAGPPLVLLHGLAEWSYTWRNNMPVLGKYVKTVAPDLPGFGLSTKTSSAGYSLGDQARSVLNWMDALDLNRVVLGGHSMGGEIALRLAHLAPDRVAALLLVASSGYVVSHLPREARWALKLPGVGLGLIRYFFFNARFVRAALRTARPGRDEVTELDVQSYLLPARTPGAASTFLRILREMDFGSFAGQIHTIRQPALLVWGADDPWVPVAHGQHMAQQLPAGQLHVWPDTGHLPHEERPDDFNHLVVQWLKDLGYSEAVR